MLIEFRVKNFRSIKDEQVFSMVASNERDAGADNQAKLISTGIRSIPYVLRNAVVLGPNAGGKSNLIRAFSTMRKFVADSATTMQFGFEFPLQSFLLNEKTAQEPSEFELTFVSGGIRYQYGFRLDRTRVHEEWLLVYVTSKARLWFSRTFNPETERDEYKFGPHLKGRRELWKESTRPNALFLSQAIQLNCEQLQPVFNWITSGMVVMDGPVIPWTPDAQQKPATQALLREEGGRGDVLAFLSSADLGISEIKVDTKKGYRATVKFDPKLPAPQLSNEAVEFEVPQFVHVTDDGRGTFDLNDESMGTQKLFGLAGPVLEVLKSGSVLVADELDCSLHVHLIMQLVSLFANPSINRHGAQLVFTTHNTSLLDCLQIRRDQVWFIEKDRSQASVLYPVTDFSPRKNESIERGYLKGRYGAVPFLSDSFNPWGESTHGK